MIERQKYLDRLIACKDNGMPKVITGIRRCSKTYLLTTIFRKYLLSIGVANENIIMLSMDDDSCAEYLNPLALGKYVREL
ncbi:MAG: AAA family ATPase, partial [Bacilli bacterium]|nr:AAA family ATPase [Bacilli bacterium]